VGEHIVTGRTTRLGDSKCFLKDRGCNMWFEVIRWSSMVLMWVALALNVWGVYRNHKLSEQYRGLIDKLLELKEYNIHKD
jgi:hypothetical protein